MSDMFSAISPFPAPLTLSQLQSMVAVAKAFYALRNNSAYRQAVLADIPEIARFDPGHDSVMMGYDFHLTEQGPALIEVNTNAGGCLLAWLAYARYYGHPEEVPTPVRGRLLQTFSEEWRRYGGAGDRPKRVVILDHSPTEQHLYPEMKWFASVFHDWGCACEIADPSELTAVGNELRLQGEPVDLIYNRHTDFYLDTPEMALVRQAYRNGSVCLTPNPHAYGLLADKRRLLQLSTPNFRQTLGLSSQHEEAFANCLLECRLMKDWEVDELWAHRKEFVFKPVAHFGGKGVLMGKSITHKRFNELPPGETLVQRLAPASLTEAGEDRPMKSDYRLFVYRDQILGVTARLYHGQLTNLRTEGGGFAPVDIEE